MKYLGMTTSELALMKTRFQCSNSSSMLGKSLAPSKILSIRKKIIDANPLSQRDIAPTKP
jgi:hypothetical protein